MQNSLLPIKFLLILTLCWGLAACSSDPVKQPSQGHLGTQPSAVDEAPKIPPPVTRAPVLPPPSAEPQLETYTVIVNQVPVKELLFALARDAKLNLDIYDDIEGLITINAIDQTLPQILDRIGRQTNIRYQIEDNNLVVSADTPYLKTYKVPYVNMSRESVGRIDVTTQIASAGTVSVGDTGGGGGGGGGGNNSTLSIRNTSDHDFWNTLLLNVASIIGENTQGGAASDNVIINPEAGLISVRATSKQHANVQAWIDTVLTSVQRQVLIEATVAEVSLSSRYQAGVDWSRLTTNMIGELPDGVNIEQQLTGANLAEPPTLLLSYGDLDDDVVLSASIRLLQQFGDVKVLSSPKIMALNNQTSVLKVVDNRIYFTIEAETSQNQVNTVTSFETEVHTVPVGFMMSLIPSISAQDEIILNIRPTISRILRFVNDPNPGLAAEDIVNAIPEIQVREMESLLRLNNGQIAVIGGLMQDTINKDSDAVPGLSRIPGIGEAFRYRDNEITKTELVIFLRATVVKEPSLEGDLKRFRPFLPGPVATDS